MNSTHEKVRVSALLPSLVMKSIAEVAQRSGTTKSAVMTDALTRWLQWKLEEEAKMISEMKLSDVPTEDEWNQIQSETLQEFPW